MLGLFAAFGVTVAAASAAIVGPAIGLAAAVVAAALATRALVVGRRWGEPWSGNVVGEADGEVRVAGRPIWGKERVRFVLPLDRNGVLVGTDAEREHIVDVGVGRRQKLLDLLRTRDDAVTVSWRRQYRTLLALLGTSAATLFGYGVVSGELASVPVLGGVAATLLVMLTVSLAPRIDSLTVGNDALVIRKSVERVIPTSEIREVRVLSRGLGGHALGLDLRDGSRVRIEIGDGDATLVEALRSELEHRREAPSPSGRGGRGAASRLGRDGLDAAAWGDRLRSLLRGAGGFRDTALSEDDVLTVLEDVHADVEVRIGAAFALAVFEPGLGDLVRDVARDVASPKLREALEDAANGLLTDLATDAAVHEAENAVGRTAAAGSVKVRAPDAEGEASEGDAPEGASDEEAAAREDEGR